MWYANFQRKLFYEINYFFFPLTSQCEESKDEDKAVEAYERVLKMEPNHEKAKDAIYNLRGLAKDAEELGIDIK